MTLKQIQDKHKLLLETRNYLNNKILEIRERDSGIEDGENNKEILMLGLAASAVCTEAQRLLDKDWH